MHGQVGDTAAFPSFHLIGPMLPVIGKSGEIVPLGSRKHPRGPGRPCKAPPDFAIFTLPE